LSGKSGTLVGFGITSLAWWAWIVAHIDDAIVDAIDDIDAIDIDAISWMYRCSLGSMDRRDSIDGTERIE
jgi:hypothetical protein